LNQSIKLLQFSDTHLFADGDGRMKGVKTAVTLEAVVDLAKSVEHEVDYVLVTGDISQDCTPASYELAAEIFSRLGRPAYTLPGNHDEDIPLKQSPLMSGLFNAENHFLAGDWIVILLDSVIHGMIAGRLSHDELVRLDNLLKKHADKHALVCLHHNPVNMRPDREDPVMLKNPDDFFAVIDSHANVRAVIWGHVHQEHFEERRGVRLMACPSTCIQFKPTSTGVTIDEQTPGYRRIVLNADGSVTTKVMRLSALPEGLEVTGEDL